MDDDFVVMLAGLFTGTDAGGLGGAVTTTAPALLRLSGLYHR